MEGLGVALTVLDDLAEVDLSDVAGLLPPDRLGRFPALTEARAKDRYRTVMPGGESYETVLPRAVCALERIRGDGPGGVLIVFHEMMRTHLLGLTLHRQWL